MIELFDIEDVNKAASSFNTEKLLWLNQQYIKNSTPTHIADHLAWHMQQHKVDISVGPSLEKIAVLYQERAKTLVEMAESSLFFYNKVSSFDEKAAKKNLNQASLPLLQNMQSRLLALSEWLAEPIHTEIKACADMHEVGMGKVAQPIRVAITGNTVSPSLDVTLELLGRERTLAAIEFAIDWINNQDS